jgi:hypothetical protein
MDSKDANNCEVLRDRFEGREAIYVEKGALRVRVSNIHNIGADGSSIGADVEEIPTPGLGVGLFPLHRPGRNPSRWTIAGDPTSYSDQDWSMGYGGWSLYFSPETVQAVIDFAAQRSDNADPCEGYSEICRMLNDRT